MSCCTAFKDMQTLATGFRLEFAVFITRQVSNNVDVSYVALKIVLVKTVSLKGHFQIILRCLQTKSSSQGQRIVKNTVKYQKLAASLDEVLFVVDGSYFGNGLYLVCTHSLETPITKDEVAMLVPRTKEVIKIRLFKNTNMAIMTSDENRQLFALFNVLYHSVLINRHSMLIFRA